MLTKVDLRMSSCFPCYRVDIHYQKKSTDTTTYIPCI